ncbi:MAG: hypothetical protein GVY10_03560 [Verrucomicrobia bacterium]|nr:hypothetical protein [Verrucomicrobiota bacterium]
MVRSRFSIGGFIRKCARGGCHGLNLLLAVLACIQVALVILNQLQRVVPLPDEALRAGVRQVVPEELRLSWSRAHFDLRGGLLLENLELRRQGETSPLFTARSFHLQFSLPRYLLPDRTALRAVTVQEGRLFPPPALSPSGLPEDPVRLHHGRLSFSGESQLRVEDFYAETGALLVSLEGEGTLPAGSGDAPGAFSENLPRIVATLWRTIYTLPTEREAHVEVRWETAAEGQLFAIRSSLRSVDVPGARLSHLLLRGTLMLADGRIAVSKVEGSGTAEIDPPLPAWTQGLPRPRKVRFLLGSEGASTSLDSGVRIPQRLHLQLRGKGRAWDAFPVLGATVMPADAAPVLAVRGGSPGLFFSTTWRPEPQELLRSLSGEGAFPVSLLPKKLSLRLGLSGKVPAHLLGLPIFPEFLRQGTADRLAFSGRAFPVRRALEGDVRIDGLRSDVLASTNLGGSLRLTPEKLSLPAIHFTRPSGERGEGAFAYDLDNPHFSLRANGRLFPASLDPVLGDWWRQIFTSIETPNPADARVMVWGDPRAARSIRSSVAVVGRNASYRGVQVPELRLGIRSNARWTYLHEMEGRFPEGGVSGELAWRIHNPHDRRRPMFLRLDSDVPFPRVVRLSGIDGLSACRFEHPPRLTVSGWLWRPSKAAGEDVEPWPELRLTVKAPKGTFEVSAFSFTHTGYEVRAKGPLLLVENLSARISEGVLTGDLSFERQPASGGLRPRHLDLQLLDADLPGVLGQLDAFFPHWDLDADHLFATDQGGRLDAGFRLEFPTFGPSTGDGWLHVREAAIGSIHLFGGFSALLQQLGLGFSSLDLKTAAVDWRWEEPLLAFDHFVVSGPVLHLRMDGGADLDTRTLNINGTALLFEGLVQRFLAPVSTRLAFTVTGSLADPAWNLQLEPLRWLRDRIFSQ